MPLGTPSRTYIIHNFNYFLYRLEVLGGRGGFLSASFSPDSYFKPRFRFSFRKPSMYDPNIFFSEGFFVELLVDWFSLGTSDLRDPDLPLMKLMIFVSIYALCE